MADPPDLMVQIAAEWTHRAVAPLAGIGIVATAALAWRRRHRPVIVRPAVAAAVLLPVQVLLGGLTVTRALEPLVVTAHLGVATLVLVALTTTTVAAWFTDHRS